MAFGRMAQRPALESVQRPGGDQTVPGAHRFERAPAHLRLLLDPDRGYQGRGVGALGRRVASGAGRAQSPTDRPDPTLSRAVCRPGGEFMAGRLSPAEAYRRLDQMPDNREVTLYRTRLERLWRQNEAQLGPYPPE